MEYPENTYPDYCLGPWYMMSRETTNKLFNKFEEILELDIPYFVYVWIEDVYVTG